MRFTIGITFLLGCHMVYGDFFNRDKVKDFIKKNIKTVLTESEYCAYIDQGKEIASRILKNKPCTAFERKTYLSEIIAFIWYMYALAVSKDQGFINGVIVLEDREQRFYNFLYTYVKNINPASLLHKALISTNPYAYGRRSTHFMDDQKNHMQYGIDIRLNHTKKAELLLPTHKAHILFGRLEDGCTFIKLERHGLYYKDGFVGHVGGFLNLLIERTMAQLFWQKENPLSRKEYLPLWIKSSYKKLYKKVFPFKTIKEVVKKSYDEHSLLLLLEKIERMYDNISFRYGKEVILSYKEIIECMSDIVL